jgi:parallel beta-helix repeat protein
MKPVTRMIYAIAFASVGLALPVFAATHFVPASYSTIADGLGAAVAGDTVLVAIGTYLEHDLILPSGVILRGATGDPGDVVIDGERLGRCVYGAGLDATTRLEAMTLTNGLPAWGSTPHNSWGGGLMVDGGSLTVTSCVFRANETAIGGGAYIIGQGSLLVEDCLFDRNEASEDAGMLIRGVCDPIVRRCTFTGGDQCMAGGGLGVVVTGDALVEDCTITNNTVLETGGGLEIYGSGGRVTVRNCEISGNSASIGGGGVFVGNGGQAFLEDCTITVNTAGGYGGGVTVSFNSVLTANQSTILGNNAPIGADGTTATSATATLECCEIDLASWAPDGPLTVINEGCDVATENTTWGSVKSLYR